MPRPKFETIDLFTLDNVVGGAVILDENGQPVRTDDGMGLLDWDGGGDDSGDTGSLGDGGLDGGLTGFDGLGDGDLGDLGDGPSDYEIFTTQVDIMQNYWDGVGPATIAQGPADCYIVSTLNGVAAMPGGYDYLASLIQPEGDGFNVSLHTADGMPITVHVSGDSLQYAGASQGDGVLQVIELAIGIAHGGDDSGNPYEGALNLGGRPEATMVELGLSGNVTDVMGSLGIEGHDGVFVLGTTDDQRALSDYGLEANHAYQVIGTVTNNANGETYVVLSNPWGTDHPSPVPVSELGNLFQSTSVGQLPSTGNGTTDTGSDTTDTTGSGSGQ